MHRMINRHFYVELFDKELATKLFDIAASTLERGPAEKVGLSLVHRCVGGACHFGDFREELFETA